MLGKTIVRFNLAALLAVVVTLLGLLFVGVQSVEAHLLPGSIKTTDLDGNAVQQNQFKGKCLVALNGGADQPQAQHLPDGFYDVAITNPSGSSLLGVGEGTVEVTKGEGTFGPVSLCSIVSPSPFGDTDNNGGVYKVWLCLPDHLEVVNGQLDADHNGCKTSTFKVTESAPPVVGPPVSKTPAPPTDTPTLLVTPTPTFVVKIEPPATVTGPTPTPEVIVPIKLPQTGGGTPLGSGVERTSLLTAIALAIIGLPSIAFGLVRLRN